ncbi:MAG: hypothetical protein LBN38_05825 [Verrucomicrobiota bacterium]|nr:hypothetical protein [Verrucomicrobiota bacterium]
MNRDPIEEGVKLKPPKNWNRRGIEHNFPGIEPNLYRFVRNNALLFLDSQGWKPFLDCAKGAK